MPGDDDLDNLIDSYVADALRSSGIRSEGRSRPSPSYAPANQPIEIPDAEPAALPYAVAPQASAPQEVSPQAVAPPAVAPPAVPRVVTPRAKAPTPTGVAMLAAELFSDVGDEVTPPPVDLGRAAPIAALPPPMPMPPPVAMPPMPAGPSITFNRPSAQPARVALDPPPAPAPPELYMNPPLPGLTEPGPPVLPETLPGIGPQALREGDAFATDVPTDPDAQPPIVETDDEPTNIVAKFPP